MLTAKDQAKILPLTSIDQTRVLKHIMKVLSSRCHKCNKRKKAVWDVRSDGVAGRTHCVECGCHGFFHKDEIL